jgi:hypothetical protein
MLNKYSVRAGQVLNDPRARVIFVLATLVAAILAGGAPNDYGGG